MKNLFIALALVFLSAPLIAQTDNDIIEIERSVLNAEKKAIVAENMILTEDEADAFWPVYEEFSAELYKLQTERVKVIKEYAKFYQKLDDKKADELLTRSLKHRQDVAKLEFAYAKKFKKVLSPSKVARFYQIHNKVTSLINAEIALEIPLVETK